eukprot:scaffold63816_cov63-Phaeocystis_antarctica.AAC.7
MNCGRGARDSHSGFGIGPGSGERIGDFELRCSSFEPSCAVATPFCNSLQICVAVCCPVSTPPATHMSHVSPYQRRTRKWCAGCTYWEQGATL